MAAKKMKTLFRRAQIADAALKVISEKGVSGLTISAIAGKVGITESNIYRHYKGKGEVVLAVVLEIRSFMERMVGDARRGKGNAVECLKEIFFAHVSFLESHRGIPRIFMSDEMYADDKMLLNEMRALVAGYIRALTEIIDKGRKDRLMDRALDAEASAAAFLGLLQSMALQWFVSGYSFSIKTRSRKIWDIYLKAILPRG